MSRLSSAIRINGCWQSLPLFLTPRGRIRNDVAEVPFLLLTGSRCTVLVDNRNLYVKTVLLKGTLRTCFFPSRLSNDLFCEGKPDSYPHLLPQVGFS